MMSEKLSTVQKRENLNSVYRRGDIGPGGAYHNYDIRVSQAIGGKGVEGATLAEVIFQKGPRKEKDAQHGVLDSDLLEIVKDRLEHFDKGEFATKEGAMALSHITEALLWLNKRVEDRIERQVLGTYEK